MTVIPTLLVLRLMVEILAPPQHLKWLRKSGGGIQGYVYVYAHNLVLVPSKTCIL